MGRPCPPDAPSPLAVNLAVPNDGSNRGGPQIPDTLLRWLRAAEDRSRSHADRHATAHEHSREAEIKVLQAKVGELTIEKNFLANAFGR